MIFVREILLWGAVLALVMVAIAFVTLGALAVCLVAAVAIAWRALLRALEWRWFGAE